GMHGETDHKEGWEVDTCDGKTLTGRDVKERLVRLPCQVICMLETCGSGGFARDHKDDVPLPPNVTALCACRPRQETENQLDIALGEALRGRADFNHDGLVQIPE